MSRTAYKFSAVIVSLLVTAALSACGTDKKEGNVGPADVARVADEATCRVCHSDTLDPVSRTSIVSDFLPSSHNPDNPDNRAHPDITQPTGCQGCHGGGAQHNGVGPIPFPNPLASDRCVTCHTDADLVPLFAAAKAGFVANNCAHCHTSTGVGSVHAAQVPTTEDCVFCHSVAAPNHGTDLVNDNNGVRAITTEFAKWSHHVTGVTLNSAHCAACHLEGTVGADQQIVVDATKHMVDAKTHLRNADTDAEILWDPAAPNHTDMDNFCLSCHDANGATSPISAQIQGFINRNGLRAAGKTASASNPFGDTISNRYDKMQRPAVVDASSQFNTTNNSHHAVKGPRYSGRTRLAGDRQIANPATFAQNSSALLQGKRSTIYDAGNFNQLYTPLENTGGEAAPRTGAKTLGDDSTLHCGDCHTVGQWKVGSSETASGTPTPAAIGAHGSNNEYLLRNSIGTDQRHTQNAFLLGTATGTVLNPTTGVALALNEVFYTNPNGAFLVCYNCHNYNKYGSLFLQTGVVGGHVGEYDQQGRCNGIGNTLPFNGYTTGIATDGTQFASRFNGPISVFSSRAPYVGEQNPDFGNIFGIQCSNCHNSGAGNAYGGIHGSKVNTYRDGMGNTVKAERFLPGLGNAMHVPGTLGGITGGSPATFLRYSANAARTAATELPIRDNSLINTTTNKNVGSYQYTTGGISSDTNWEQKHWQQTARTVLTATGASTGGTLVSAGAGCYTLGDPVTALSNGAPIPSRPAATSIVAAPSVTGQGGAPTTLFETWGGCDDHNAPQGGGDHGFVKKIVRPVTY